VTERKKKSRSRKNAWRGWKRPSSKDFEERREIGHLPEAL
jgi:hypothetical protein